MRKTILAFFLTVLCLCGSIFALEPPVAQAKAALLYEATTGEMLVSQNIDEKLFPASTTKMLTALVAVEHCKPEDMITVNKSALDGLYEQGSSSRFQAGDQMDFLGMLKYLLIASGNDAANAIAEHIAGSQANFALMMNQKAKDLGCTDTNFVNPHGLHSEQHYTTARDLLKIAMACMENDTIADIVGTAQERVVFYRGGTPYGMTLHNTNCLLSTNTTKNYIYDGVFGIKTGTTTPAGLCLVAGARSGSLTFYTVVLGAPKSDDGKLYQYEETVKLLDYGTQHFSIQKMVDTGKPVTEAPVELAKDRDSVVLMPAENISALLPDDFTLDQVKVTYTVQEDIVAPIAKGDVLGTASYSYNGRDYGSVELVAALSIERSQTLYMMHQVKAFVSSTAFKVGLISFVALLVLIIVIVVIHHRRAKNRRYSSVRRKH